MFPELFEKWKYIFGKYCGVSGSNAALFRQVIKSYNDANLLRQALLRNEDYWIEFFFAVTLSEKKLNK